MAPSLGAVFRRAERLRLVSDYIGEPTEQGQARIIGGEAGQLIAAVEGLPRRV